jgi:predicted NUDIX family NTP pyrophosphohydrolase
MNVYRNAGESARETAFRETEEELGILVPDDKLEHLFSTKQQHVLNAGSVVRGCGYKNRRNMKK